MNYCTAICEDPFPGEQAWICSEPNGHGGPHREGNVAWSSGGSQVPDRHGDRGSALVVCLVLCCIFAAVVWACIALAPDVDPILEQVDDSVAQFIGGAA